ncbi:pyridine nucleotide-disulfide oxidoreductase domain-containing protein 2-like [Watersipora subatra]|uniref:pyridine nucleotide-disulfide oxidoreductase domain-containing protein 2-like n=1 Tax=Watersipora subatra TaxID=2589382 RepID=UPI00355AFFA9
MVQSSSGLKMKLWNSLKTVRCKYYSTGNLKPRYDAVVIGGGHNGLVAAAYLAKGGKSVCVLERRHLVGGAAVTEEIVPGYKFSRCSYVLSLLRPKIIADLELKKYGLKVYPRDPYTFTPLLEEPSSTTGLPRSLLLGSDPNKNHQQLSQFSKKDADAYPRYEETLEKLVDALQPLLDSSPPDLNKFLSGSLREKLSEWRHNVKPTIETAKRLGNEIPYFYELLTSPATKILERWFESEPLKATLATDAIIGATISPSSSGSSYVLLHHVMGELDGRKGAWGYVEGGMGALSEIMATAAKDRGAEIFTSKTVSQIHSQGGKVKGVILEDGQEISADVILSNATPEVTFLKLMDKNDLPSDFYADVKSIDYTSPVTKINVAVNKLPSFLAAPNEADNSPLPHHQCTIHLNCESTDLLHQAFLADQNGTWSSRPVIEMTIPSSKDPTLAPQGHHIVQLFTMYTPYSLSGGRKWDDSAKNEYADCVFDSIESYAPGFKESVVGREILTPPDLEEIFGLTGGNIFHGAMALDQLYLTRPTPKYSGCRTPIDGLYLCGSGAHPGGGVMGSPGRLAAEQVLRRR